MARTLIVQRMNELVGDLAHLTVTEAAAAHGSAGSKDVRDLISLSVQADQKASEVLIWRSENGKLTPELIGQLVAADGKAPSHFTTDLVLKSKSNPARQTHLLQLIENTRITKMTPQELVGDDGFSKLCDLVGAIDITDSYSAGRLRALAADAEHPMLAAALMVANSSGFGKLDVKLRPDFIDPLNENDMKGSLRKRHHTMVLRSHAAMALSAREGLAAQLALIEVLDDPESIPRMVASLRLKQISLEPEARRLIAEKISALETRGLEPRKYLNISDDDYRALRRTTILALPSTKICIGNFGQIGRQAELKLVK